MEMKVFVFLLKGFWFFTFYEKVAKPDKRNLKRGLAVALDVKNS